MIYLICKKPTAYDDYEVIETTTNKKRAVQRMNTLARASEAAYLLGTHSARETFKVISADGNLIRMKLG